MDLLAIAFTYLVLVAVLAIGLPVMIVLRLVTMPFDAGRLAVGRVLRLSAVVVVRSCPLWRVRFEGKWPAKGRRAYVLVSNHESNIDPFLLSHIPREVKWMAKDSLLHVPWLGWMLRLAGDIPVVRGEHGSGEDALKKARHYLDLGVPVMIFPEGTRSRDGKLLPFKTGAFRLAIESGCPILPCVVSGTSDALEPGSLRLRRAYLRARLLEPIEVSGMGHGDVERLKDSVRSVIETERARLSVAP
jgi:1-acyl-sn-glycerol-3-phosphate acyltransferase